MRRTIQCLCTMVVLLSGAAAADQVFVVETRERGAAPGCKQFGDGIGKGVTFLRATYREKACTTTVYPAPDAEARFIADLLADVRADDKPLILFIHGSGQTYANVLEISSKLSDLYQARIVALDWPMSVRTGNYKVAREKAKAGAAAFLGPMTRILSALQDDQGLASRRVVLFAHSMGNYALQTIADSLASAPSLGRIDRIVLNAPDVFLDQHQAWLQKIADARRPAYVTINEDDRVIGCADGSGGLVCALAVSNVVEGSRLGNTVPEVTFARHTTYLNVTNVDGMGEMHQYYLGKPKALQPVFRSLFRDAEVLLEKCKPLSAAAPVLVCGG